MILIEQTITRKGTGFSAKAFREILKAGWLMVGRWWHEKILPGHFKEGAGRVYSVYEPREPSTVKRKRRRFGHNRPNVYTGELMHQVLRTEDVRPTSKGASVVLHGPSYLYKRWATGTRMSRVKKHLELTAITKKEARQMARIMDRHIERAMNAAAGPTIRIGGGHRRPAA